MRFQDACLILVLVTFFKKNHRRSPVTMECVFLSHSAIILQVSGQPSMF